MASPGTVHLDVTRVDSADVVAHARLCVAVLGEDLTAYIAGADSVRELMTWLGGEETMPVRATPRLAAAAEVIRSFEIHNVVSMVRPWLRELGPGGQPPARLIRVEGDDESAMKNVFQAATSWLGSHRAA
jgi:hypothetical protein